jgi:cytochrome c553
MESIKGQKVAGPRSIIAIDPCFDRSVHRWIGHCLGLKGVLNRADSRYTSRLAICRCYPAMKKTALMLAVTALAFASTSAFAKGDPVEGKKLVYTCTGCHGIDGYKNAYPNYHVPRLGGQNEQYIINALTEYKKGERAHPTMRAQAESFSAQDIANIAAYLSSVGTGSEK